MGIAALQQNLRLVENLEALAKKKGVTPGQLALAWVLARGDDVIPIPGTKRTACVDENVAAVHIKLTPQELQELEDAVPHNQVLVFVLHCFPSSLPLHTLRRLLQRTTPLHLLRLAERTLVMTSVAYKVGHGLKLDRGADAVTILMFIYSSTGGWRPLP